MFEKSFGRNISVFKEVPILSPQIYILVADDAMQ